MCLIYSVLLKTNIMYGFFFSDWSILYVVIVCFLIVVGTAGISWAICCCWKKRRCRWRTKKRSKYSLLPQIDAGKDSPDVYSKSKCVCFFLFCFYQFFEKKIVILSFFIISQEECKNYFYVKNFHAQVLALLSSSSN